MYILITDRHGGTHNDHILIGIPHFGNDFTTRRDQPTGIALNVHRTVGEAGPDGR